MAGLGEVAPIGGVWHGINFGEVSIGCQRCAEPRNRDSLTFGSARAIFQLRPLEVLNGNLFTGRWIDFRVLFGQRIAQYVVRSNASSPFKESDEET